MLETLTKDKFIDAIERGDIYIDFNARSGHNHGTKFRLQGKVLVDLYEKSQAYQPMIRVFFGLKFCCLTNRQRQIRFNVKTSPEFIAGGEGLHFRILSL